MSARIRPAITTLFDSVTHPNAMFAACLAFVFWLGFAVGNSLITQRALDDQRLLYGSSLDALRDGIRRDRLADWRRHGERPKGGRAIANR